MTTGKPASHYNFNRYYDTEVGRYLSPDPLGLGPAANHYTYVDDPLAFTDPLGLAEKCRQDVTWGGHVQWHRDHRGGHYEMNVTINPDMLDEGTGAKQSIHPPDSWARTTDTREATCSPIVSAAPETRTITY
ncbi:RHS repeat-associated core domain-containing protein [Streptomyces sp. NPDC048483]|uniref:RHS repeat-associated core domain-containing protein n=1 Tax=Streptomyces sp. NPDC048483 TaxID=3154927 RepID=UPI003443FAD6